MTTMYTTPKRMAKAETAVMTLAAFRGGDQIAYDNQSSSASEGVSGGGGRGATGVGGGDGGRSDTRRVTGERPASRAAEVTPGVTVSTGEDTAATARRTAAEVASGS